jgi:hypothetical protein
MPKEPAQLNFIGSIFVEPEDQRLLEVIEVGDFPDDAAEVLSADEIEELKQEVACLRQLGSVIEGTGGLRKFRYGAKGKGKRGGARVLYYYGGDHMPIFLIAIYPKSEKENISAAEKKAGRKLIQTLIDENKPKSQPKLRVVKSVKGKRR